MYLFFLEITQVRYEDNTCLQGAGVGISLWLYPRDLVPLNYVSAGAVEGSAGQLWVESTVRCVVVS